MPELPELPNFNADTTSQHANHTFDMNCKICVGQISPPLSSTGSVPPVTVASSKDKEKTADPFAFMKGKLPSPPAKLPSTNQPSLANKTPFTNKLIPNASIELTEAIKNTSENSASVSDKPILSIPTIHVPPSEQPESKQPNQNQQEKPNPLKNLKWNRYIVDEKDSQVYTTFTCLSAFNEEKQPREATFLSQIHKHLFGDPTDASNHYESFKIARYNQVKSFWPEMCAKQGLVIIKFEPNELEVDYFTINLLWNRILRFHTQFAKDTQ